MSMDLALADAANNCDRRGAKACITLKVSGVQYEGRLKRDTTNFDTVLLYLDHGGFVTIDKEEIAAVESKP